MKSVLKHTIITMAAVLTFTPAFAAENTSAPRMPTKGTKFYQSYQSMDVPTSGQNQAAAQAPTDVQDIAPAAGGMDEKADTGRSLREEMRLPRKN